MLADFICMLDALLRPGARLATAPYPLGFVPTGYIFVSCLYLSLFSCFPRCARDCHKASRYVSHLPSTPNYFYLLYSWSGTCSFRPIASRARPFSLHTHSCSYRIAFVTRRGGRVEEPQIV